ncbi:thioredoxin fold domain-containing protein [Trinickia fusca]|nr:thioredoxin fold domain-containing protein [Trinickia fusca]
MKLKFESNRPQARDIVLVEPDGTVYTSFGKSGYLNAATRTRFASGQAAATGAFSISSGEAPPDGEPVERGTANHGLVFVSEVDGQEKVALIERFATEQDARHALMLVQSALRRYVLSRRYGRVWRVLLRGVGVPFVTLLVTMALVRYLDSHNGSIEALNTLLHTAQANPQAGLLPGIQPPPGSAPAVLPPARADVPALSAQPAPTPAFAPAFASASGSDASSPEASAFAHAPAVTRAMTSIHFGLENQPPGKTLYVYSDPNCPACRRFESHIDDLSKDFSVYVFPVAYQDGSAKVAAQILCAQDRKQKWIDTMTHAKSGDVAAGNDCVQAYSGIKANMESFDALGFTSTPRIVSGTGYVFAPGATANAIRIQTAAQ